jgi:hypothetical protein
MADDNNTEQSQDESGNKEEMVERIDPKTGKKILIPKIYDVYIGHTIAKNRIETEQKATEKYKPLIEKLESENSELSDIRTEYEKLKEENLTVEERAQAATQRALSEGEKKTKLAEDKARTWQNRHGKLKIKNDVFSSFGDVKLCNADQTADLMILQGAAVVEPILDGLGKETGEFKTKLTLPIMNKEGEIEIMEGTPAELFKLWINQPSHLHHQSDNLKSGSGSTIPNGRGTVAGLDINLLKTNPEEVIRQVRAGQK